MTEKEGMNSLIEKKKGEKDSVGEENQVIYSLAGKAFTLFPRK